MELDFARNEGVRQLFLEMLGLLSDTIRRVYKKNTDLFAIYNCTLQILHNEVQMGKRLG